MYEDMLVNIEKFKVEEEYLLSEFANNHEKTLVTKLASISGQQLNNRIGTSTPEMESGLCKELNDLEKDLNAKVKEYLEKINIETKSLKKAEESISKIATQISIVKDELTDWNQSVAVIQESMKDIPDTIEKLAEDDPKKVAKEIGEKEITYKDAEGKEVKKNDSFQRCRIANRWYCRTARSQGTGSHRLIIHATTHFKNTIHAGLVVYPGCNTQWQHASLEVGQRREGLSPDC